MTKYKVHIIAAVCLLMAALCGPVLAHQQNESLTSILFNQRSGLIEVSHRFYIHDAEHVVKRIAGGKADLHGGRETQETFAQYVINGFSVIIDGESPLGLTLLGHEVKGKFFWIYQEAPLVTTPQQIDVAINPPKEVIPSKRNIVNIEGLGKIKSVELTPANPADTVLF